MADAPGSGIAGRGTPESDWLPFLESLDPPRLELTPVPRRVVVVAPHPDDEVLGAGGLLAVLAAAGSRIEVVAVTDGDASHPGGSVVPAQLARLRTRETHAALDALEVPAVVHRLGLPDGGADTLEDAVVGAVTVDDGTLLLGPWAHDGHPDHEAVGRACTRIAGRDGARSLSYPVWMWHWAGAGDPRVPWAAARTLVLQPDVRRRKDSAVRCFVTQIEPLGPLPQDAPILPGHVRARFARDVEVFLP